MSDPEWSSLHAVAAAQDGHFTTAQAAEAGYSRPLVAHPVQAGRFLRFLRGIYRLRDFPAAEYEDLVVAWLWSQQAGVLSHETALLVHRLSNAPPARIHLTVPSAWRGRRLKVPPLLHPHHGDIPDADQTWSGPVPVTRPLPTVVDCLADHAPPRSHRTGGPGGPAAVAL